MRSARALLALFALIAIVIAAPLAAHARAHGDVILCDDAADSPATADSYDVPTVHVLRQYVLVELDRIREQRSPVLVTLSFAPKTSPPSH